MSTETHKCPVVLWALFYHCHSSRLFGRHVFMYNLNACAQEKLPGVVLILASGTGSAVYADIKLTC